MKQTIGRYASRPVVAVDAEATVLEALQQMYARRISCVLILSHGEPVGILTERDVVFAANWLLGQPDLLIKEVMSKPVMTASEEMGVAQAYRIFKRHSIRHLVVLDARLDMAGVFTQSDLVRSLGAEVFSGISDVSGFMSPQVLQVAPEVPVRYALSQMARRSVSCVVVSENGRPVGMFTERDVVRNVALGIDLNDVKIRDVMSNGVVSTPVKTAPQESVALMLKKSIRRLLVTDEQGGMAGILTQTDIGRVLDRQEAGLLDRLLGDPGLAAPGGLA